MTAFFNSDEETSTQTEETQEPAKLSIGGAEYTQEEVENLVGLGKIAREAEEKYDTKIDRVWPEYSRTVNEKKKLELELEGLRQSQRQAQTPDQLNQEQLVKQAQDQARKLGILLGDDFEQLLDKHFAQKYVAQREADRLWDDMNKLETDINGKDGRPAFKSREIIEHMQETGIKNPLKAYKDKYDDQWTAWQLKQVEEKRKPGDFFSGGRAIASKAPPTRELNRNNLQDAIAEALAQE